MECLIAEMKVLISAKVTGVSPDDSLITVKRGVQTGKSEVLYLFAKVQGGICIDGKEEF